MKTLIGITGRARSGKDTLAQVFVEAGFRRIAFADPLKDATAFIADEPVGLYHDDVTKEEVIPHLGVTRRAALQGLGNSAREFMGADVWVGRAMRSWSASGESPTVISDVRYPSEAEAIRKLGGIVIEVVRRGAGLSGEAAEHISEKPIPPELIDITILNDGTIGDLKVEARKALYWLTSRRAEHLGVDL